VRAVLVKIQVPTEQQVATLYSQQLLAQVADLVVLKRILVATVEVLVLVVGLLAQALEQPHQFKEMRLVLLVLEVHHLTQQVAVVVLEVLAEIILLKLAVLVVLLLQFQLVVHL
jgi:hypothetical protein